MERWRLRVQDPRCTVTWDHSSVLPWQSRLKHVGTRKVPAPHLTWRRSSWRKRDVYSRTRKKVGFSALPTFPLTIGLSPPSSQGVASSHPPTCKPHTHLVLITYPYLCLSLNSMLRHKGPRLLGAPRNTTWGFHQHPTVWTPRGRQGWEPQPCWLKGVLWACESTVTQTSGQPWILPSVPKPGIPLRWPGLCIWNCLRPLITLESKGDGRMGKEFL